MNDSCYYLKLKHDFILFIRLLDFTDVNVGEIGERILVIRNSGTAELLVSHISSDNTAFTVSDTSASVAAGDSVIIIVLFQPVVTGIDSATITITSNDGDEQTVTVNAIGTGTTPEITLSATTVAIGNVSLGTSGSGSFYIRNDGNQALGALDTCLGDKWNRRALPALRKVEKRAAACYAWEPGSKRLAAVASKATGKRRAGVAKRRHRGR